MTKHPAIKYKRVFYLCRGCGAVSPVEHLVDTLTEKEPPTYCMGELCEQCEEAAGKIPEPKYRSGLTWFPKTTTRWERFWKRLRYLLGMRT